MPNAVIRRHCVSSSLRLISNIGVTFQALIGPNRSFAERAYIHRVGKEPLVYRNLGQQLQRAAERYGKRLAVISYHEGQRLSFAEAKREAEKLAAQLRDLDMQQGEHLGIWAPNTVQWYISFLAAALAGLPLVCINPAFQAQELTYALQKAKVKALITTDTCGKHNYYEVLRRVLPDLETGAELVDVPQIPTLRRVLMKTSQTETEFLNYDDLLARQVRSQDVVYLNFKVPQISPESPCNIQFTSGTTGRPKATLLTHFGSVNQAQSFGVQLDLHESHKRICLTVPLFHVFGLGAAVSALAYGATLVLPSANFNSVAALEAIEKEACNVVLGTPTMYVDIVQQQEKLKKSLHSLELGIVGGAACTPQLYHKVKAVLGLRQLRVGYGMSEATSAIFCQDGTEEPHTAALSVGKLFPHGEAKVINETGDTVAFGQPGELCVRGYFTMQGYFEDEVSTNQTKTVDGWLKTGDEFVLDHTGVGHIIGRKKELIIRGGENIFPKEIEDFLDTHEDILEAQVVGVPDERMGEELCAFLRLKPDVPELSKGQVQEFCKNNIAHFKIPRYVRIVQEFPKTNSGKIQKFKLQELFVKS